MPEMQHYERRVLLSSMADRIESMFLGSIPHGPMIEAIEETLKEEGVVLVNEWESYEPPAAPPRASSESADGRGQGGPDA